MNILFAGGNGYLPEMSGGVQSSTDHLVRQCAAAGHDVSVLAALFGQSTFGFMQRLKLKLSPLPIVTDRTLGYPVMRAWFPWQEAAGAAVRQVRPDVAVVQCHKAALVGEALQRLGIPLVVYLRNVEYHELGGDLRTLTDAHYIANSEFTARAYKAEFGIDSTVIPPTIDPSKYTTETTREVVTFINVYPEKGFEKAVEIARACPDIPFQFCESWRLDDDHLAKVRATLDPLPNVTFRRRTDDMKSVYGRTAILLAPSRWEEAWGRVASEAQCSGIPVLGSTRGGLPEAIGDGGVTLDYDAPLDAWVGTLKRLWADRTAASALSEAARRHAARPAMDPAHQFATFLSVLEDARRPTLDRQAA
ncbi:glycosyl transferase family 1 [Acuticoccus sediminis]|uniref:Glycosyl transferase family 1 n=1 Tax=Acuticoccus sediminis TaxID=2184697 RepID=A0A8B2NUH1_9HYPH|nr:glycosyltransferase [Acuticoccus sediminis]RAI03838.1 glycosyl transferase family 1 [Acuticoccus sediminis]